MSRLRRCALSLACLLACNSLLRAAPPDPLRLVPDVANAVIKIENPRRIVDAVLQLPYLAQVRELEGVKEALASTNLRLFEQFLSYYERDLGVDRLEMLDKLGGGGVLLAIKYGDPAPVLFIVQSTDEAFLAKFAQTVQRLAETEIKRLDGKEPLVRERYRDTATIRFGKDLHAALLGSALAVANKKEALTAAIDLHLDGPNKSMLRHKGPTAARKLLPKDPLVWGWFDLEPVHKNPEVEKAFKLPRNDVNQTVLLGTYLDTIGRSPFVSVGVYRDAQGFRTTIRLPGGRDGVHEALTTHVPPVGQPGSRPLLEPHDVLFSTSYYFDIAAFWHNRTRLFNETVVKEFEKNEKNPGATAFLGGNRLSNVFDQGGAYHRFVAAHQGKSGYNRRPTQNIPAFAFVLETRDPEKFTRTMNFVLRVSALATATQFKAKLVEEDCGDYKLIGFRFKEGEDLGRDRDNFRFNFSPCFAMVGNQFLACSTMELGRELVDVLQQEAKDRDQRSSKAVSQTQFYARGGAALLKEFEDVLFAQTSLGQALPPDIAQRQVDLILDLVRRLGVVRLETVWNPKSFQFDVQWKLGN